MSSVINLNQFRKKQARAGDVKQAAERRAAFGRSKEERTKASHERQRSETELDNKRLE